MKKRDEKEERWGGVHLSLDLILEILNKLPVKSLVRFQSVSKEWLAVIGTHRHFIDSIVTRSLPPKLPVFIFHHLLPEKSLFTVSPALSLSTKDGIIIPGSSIDLTYEYQYVRGLICCYSSESPLVTIYNPTTRQSLFLPEIRSGMVPPPILSYCHFGYDPVMNQYKVLYTFTNSREMKQTYHVFTLGKQSWRRIQGFDDKKFIASIQGVCIDGTIYYGATRLLNKEDNTFGEVVLLSFDISSERFDHVWAPDTLSKALSAACDRTLVNYLAKLGCIYCDEGGTTMWIMESAKKQEWFKVTFCLPQYPLDIIDIYCDGGVDGFSGITPAGEIFVTQCMYYFDEPLYVYYYNVKQNSFRRVEIPGTRPEKIPKKIYCIIVFAIHDHVENTMRL